MPNTPAANDPPAANAPPPLTDGPASSPTDYESDSSDGDSLPEVSQILSQCTSKSTLQDPSPSNDSEPFNRPSQDKERVEAQELRSPSTPMAKEEVIDESIPMPSPARSQMQTRKSARKSNQAPPVPSGSSAAKDIASAESASTTGTNTPKSKASTAESPKKRVSTRKRKLGTSDEVLPQVSVSQPPPAQPSKRARLGQDTAAPPSASQPLPRPVSPSKPKRPSSFAAPAPVATPKPSYSQATPKTAPANTKGKGKQKAAIRKRSANFWHLDGSVVVQVQNTLFRLHRSRLAQQSEFFAKLFAADGRSKEVFDPEIIEERDIVDSCPVHQVKNVSVLDFERLLTALDAGIAYAINPPPFHVLASLLRAAHTLSFKTILAFATHLLREMWSQDLSRLSSYSPERRVHALETILLGQQCSVPEMLKPAYYELLRAPAFGQDLPAYVHAESEAAGAAPKMLETDEDEARAPPARLATSDFVRLAAARDALQKEWLALVRPPLPSAFPCPLAALARTSNAGAEGSEGDGAPESSKRATARECATAQKADVTGWTARLLQNGVFEVGFADVFEGIRQLIEMEWGEMGYCVGCVSERRDAWEDTRKRLWRQLDVLLGLKGEDEG
ncbi:hypothetical protein GSI_10777 [Ganoderma sinense ZZ0214-1]|uniref:BTB domain-containing protein n=1 Tax=Ganoderma sinense ZZ0214-1 TaxID=1077348 RepID=A0A2G8S1I9_9APHY|nr:hypothetical protein GSI_10777 [Ganoderma sinense ZZ0214-1]